VAHSTVTPVPYFDLSLAIERILSKPTLGTCDYESPESRPGACAQISSNIAGNCHDAGAAYPTTGNTAGQVLTSNGVAGTYNVNLNISKAPNVIASGQTNLGTSTINTGLCSQVATRPLRELFRGKLWRGPT
jgi:hypothetical protein